MRLDGLALAAGAYTIRWTAAAQDGHIERGTTDLHGRRAGAAARRRRRHAADRRARRPSARRVRPRGHRRARGRRARPPAVSSPHLPRRPEQSPVGTSTGDVLLPIAVGLLVVGVVGALVLRRSRRA